MKNQRLTILQTAIPDYRGGFFGVIREQLGERFSLYGGSEYFESSVKTDQKIGHIPIVNNYFLGRRFLWQKGVTHLIHEKGLVVLEMNPRILSNWFLLLSRKRKKLPTVLWGHAWPRSGQDSKTDKLRHQMRKLADSIIVYTKQQAVELKQKMPAKEITAAPNALFFEKDMMPAFDENASNIIYVGRLTETKKPLFLVKAFAASINAFSQNTELLIVGDGEEREKLENYVSSKNLSRRVKILGHISDFQKLKELYASSFMSVSPGYIGLSVTQSFAFGVPMLISKDEPHSPEIEMVVEHENALFYKTDDIESFKEKAFDIFESKEFWLNKRAEISTHCRENYTVELMAEVFIKQAEKYGA